MRWSGPTSGGVGLTVSRTTRWSTAGTRASSLQARARPSINITGMNPLKRFIGTSVDDLFTAYYEASMEAPGLPGRRRPGPGRHQLFFSHLP